jgi:catechol 2,3-dioxygenase-like lactoylglutathione lyase family enzyme
MERHVAARIWQRYGESEDKPMKKAKKARKVKPIPAGYDTVTPYLACGDGDAAIAFYKKAFGAAEKVRMPGPDGAAMNFLSPASRGGTTVHIHLYRREAPARARKPVLRRPHGHGAGSLRPRLASRYAHRGPVDGRDAQARRKSDEGDGQLTRARR